MLEQEIFMLENEKAHLESLLTNCEAKINNHQAHLEIVFHKVKLLESFLMNKTEMNESLYLTTAY